ncbi:MAG: 4-hydroxybenzoate octaprenyltransferase [Acidobacteria bacterium]|nr:4-hydroxybenzoate octaprenyltransferase [Acidobacteriota bacterium]MSO84174.1 4-hydroxybenzoate octaprenyltransferase [Acidobacteriota bacterium]
MNRIFTYLSFVRFSHSVFALPFALTGALLAWRQAPFYWSQVAWVMVAMVSARSAAMGFNRLVDARFDALNPRTAMREIPRGAMGRGEATVFVIVSSILFILASVQLNTVCGLLSPVALAIVFWYSIAKRFTSYTQAFLGLAMAVAPVGGWFAAGGRWGWEPWWLGLAIGLWVGGFDILYACQDVEFDRAHGLNSIPVRFGIAQSLVISRVMHVATVICMAALAWLVPLGPIYLAGVAVVAALLIFEQSLVSAHDLSQVKRAFDLNGWVGILYFVTTGAALYVG